MVTNKNKYEIDEIFRKTKYSNSDITHLMTQLRLLMEHDKLQEKYNYLNLYCNWTLHNHVSGSKTAYRILEYLTDSFISFNRDPINSKWINDTVIEGLSLHKLLENIQKIGLEYKIPSIRKFKDFNNWIVFATKLVDVLSERPLRFPDSMNNTAKLIYESIIKKTEDSGNKDLNAVIGIQFVYSSKFPNTQFWEIITPETIRKQIKLIGPIAFINQDMIKEENKRLMPDSVY